MQVEQILDALNEDMLFEIYQFIDISSIDISKTKTIKDIAIVNSKVGNINSYILDKIKRKENFHELQHWTDPTELLFETTARLRPYPSHTYFAQGQVHRKPTHWRNPIRLLCSNILWTSARLQWSKPGDNGLA